MKEHAKLPMLVTTYSSAGEILRIVCEMRDPFLSASSTEIAVDQLLILVVHPALGDLVISNRVF